MNTIAVGGTNMPYGKCAANQHHQRHRRHCHRSKSNVNAIKRMCVSLPVDMRMRLSVDLRSYLTSSEVQ